MFLPRGAAALAGWACAFVLLLSAEALRASGGRGGRPSFAPPGSAFIARQSQHNLLSISPDARISSAVRAKSSAVPGETVTKKQLVAEVAQAVDMTQKDVSSVVDEFVKLIGKHLSENKEISIPKFGLFHLSLRGARQMKNLQTGEMYTAKPVYVPNLRFYDTVKDDINSALKPR